jgi:hypothetical protein
MRVCPTIKTAGRRWEGLVRVLELVGRVLVISMVLDRVEDWSVKSVKAERKELGDIRRAHGRVEVNTKTQELSELVTSKECTFRLCDSSSFP